MSAPSGTNPQEYYVKHNPGVDRVVYAHELGHVLGQNTPVAKQINQIRKSLQVNPKLTNAINRGLEMMPEGSRETLRTATKPYNMFRGARYLAPVMAAGMIEGDDDMAASVAATIAMTAPIIADEGIASMNALKIMKEAGDPATMKQRRRLAGALGDYLAPALIAGLGGNVVGNLLD